MKRFTSDSVEERVSDVFSLPPKMMLGMLQLYMCSNQELLIENYKGILACEQECVEISYMPKGKLVVTGMSLKIAYFTERNMKIVGRIQSITFE